MVEHIKMVLLTVLMMMPGVTRCTVEAEDGPPIDLTHYEIVFADDFNATDVSANGPGTRWIAHTPWAGDFGDARFTDPGPDGPFQVNDGILSIEARKRTDGGWQSGLLASVDKLGDGFSAQYGYFEIRAKLPPGKGLWPAFWLNAMQPPGSTSPGMEVDVFEHYGHFPGDFHSTVTMWNSKIRQHNSQQAIISVPPGSLYTDFHTYGADVEPDWITIYFDRKERWRIPTPPEHGRKLLILLDLGMGSGWSITETPNPSIMYVDYVRVWQRRL